MISILIILGGCNSLSKIVKDNNKNLQPNSPTEVSTSSLFESNDLLTSTPVISNQLNVLFTATSPVDNKYNDPISCYANWCTYSGHFLLNRPISSNNNDDVDKSYRYGSTQGVTREEHHGVEFNNPTGTKVLAAADGIVEYAGNDKDIKLGLYKGFYGNLVILRHENLLDNYDVYTLYGHLSEIYVIKGQKIKANQILGEVGISGSAIGSHLHFEVRFSENQYTSTQNPELWLSLNNNSDSNLENGAIAISIIDNNKFPNNVTIKIEDISQNKSYYEETYDIKTPVSNLWNENFAMADLRPGDYRITLYNNGDFFEDYVKIESGLLTLITFNEN